MSEEKFWLEDISSLFKNFSLIPTREMSFNAKLNAATRLVLLITIILLFFAIGGWWMFFGLSILLIILIWWFFKPKTLVKTTVSTNALELPPMIKTQIDTFTNSIKQAVIESINKATKDISGSVSGAIQGAGTKASDAIRKPFERFATGSPGELIEPYACLCKNTPPPTQRRFWISARQ